MNEKQPGAKQTKTKCHACGYEWQYKGHMKRATCPNCTTKTKPKEVK